MDAYFDAIIQLVTDYPYVTVATVFLLCGVGLPMPEEIMLIFAGYATYKSDGEVSLPVMMVVCGASILAGDLIPFYLGKTFGTRLLRLRLLRYWATKDRLVVFNRWFSRHGDYVILIARFVAGFRVIAFFTAGTMKMSSRRFIALDGSGIAIIVPPVTWLAYHFGDKIDWLMAKAKEVEKGILTGAVVALVIGASLVWFRRRRRRNRQVGQPVTVEIGPSRATKARSMEDPAPAAEPGEDSPVAEEDLPGPLSLQPVSGLPSAGEAQGRNGAATPMATEPLDGESADGHLRAPSPANGQEPHPDRSSQESGDADSGEPRPGAPRPGAPADRAPGGSAG